MLTQILRRGLSAIIVIVLMSSTQPITSAHISTMPNENGVYLDDFSAYTYKAITEDVEWSIWSGNLTLERLLGSVQEDPAMTLDSNGNVVVVWEDHRNGNWDIYAQKLDTNGNRLWITDVRVNTDSGTAKQCDPGIVMGPNGSAIITWTDGRNSNDDIYAQRLDAYGNQQWASDMRINSDSGTLAQSSPSVATDTGENFVVTWADSRSGNTDIYTQRVDINGNRLWVADMRVNSDSGTTVQYSPSVGMNTSGHIIIVWTDRRNGNTDIYAQRLDINGNRLWTTDACVSSSGDSSDQSSSFVAMSDSGDIVVVWEDLRNNNSDIYAQRLDWNGARLWVADVKVNSGGVMSHQGNPTVAVDGNGLTTIAWDHNESAFDDIFVQRLSTSGSKLWTTDKRINSDIDSAHSPSMDVDQNGNIVIIWNHVSRDIRGQKLDTNGISLWMIDIRVNSDSGEARQESPSIATDENGNAIAVWKDQRNVISDLYAQKIQSNGNRVWTSDVRVNTGPDAAEQEVPNISVDDSGNNAIIVWANTRSGDRDIYAQKLDANGNRLWADDLRINTDSGSANQDSPAVDIDANGNAVIAWWDYRDGNPSIYAQRLDASGQKIWISDVLVNSDIASAAKTPPDLAISTNGAAIITWGEYRSGYCWEVYAQKIGANGNRLWATDKHVSSYGGTSCQVSPAVAADENEAIVIVWEDNRNLNTDIYSQRLDTNGNRLWVTDVLVNSDNSSAPQSSSDVAADGTGNAIVVWTDWRNNGPDIYAQKINTNGGKTWLSDIRVNSNTGATLQNSPSLGIDGYGTAAIVWTEQEEGDSYDHVDILVQKVNSVGEKSWLADLRVVYPDRFYFPSGLAQSRTIDTIAGDIRQSTLTANYQTNGGSVEFALSNNGGANWVTATLGTATVFTTTGSDLRWRAVLTGDPIWRHRSPTVTSLRIEYSTAAPYADDYEADDDCTQAKPIATGGAAQTHTFHQQADADWTWFDAITNTTYVVQATHIGLNADLELALYDTCNHAVQNGDPSLGNDVRLAFTAPTAGRYYLKTTNTDPDVFGADTDYTLSVRQERPNGLAVIVAGRMKMSDIVQANINNAANRAYLTFLQRGYSKQNIYYLNTQISQDVDDNGLNDDVDGTPSVVNVREAIQTWARQRGAALGVPLYVYLVDHGEVDRFHADLGQTVTAELLNLWLSNLEATTGADQITVILEACHSGSFVDQYQTLGYGAAEIAGPNRVIVSSTSSWANAFPLGDGVLFSGTFWDAMREGRSVQASFQQGQAAVQAAGFVNCAYPNLFCQQPWLDDNGNGVPNETTDGQLAQARGLPATLGWEVPEVAALTVNVPATGGLGTIQAEVYDNGALSAVEAMIIPPGYQPVDPGDGSLPLWNVPTVTLTTAGSNLFAGQFNFTQRGFYRVVTYARDGQNNQSAPQAATVCVNCAYVFLPLVRK